MSATYTTEVHRALTVLALRAGGAEACDVADLPPRLLGDAIPLCPVVGRPPKPPPWRTYEAGQVVEAKIEGAVYLARASARSSQGRLALHGFAQSVPLVDVRLAWLPERFSASGWWRADPRGSRWASPLTGRVTTDGPLSPDRVRFTLEQVLLPVNEYQPAWAVASKTREEIAYQAMAAGRDLVATWEALQFTSLEHMAATVRAWAFRTHATWPPTR